MPIVRDDRAVVDLVARAREGDSSAWDEVVRRFTPLVWSICRQFRLPDAEAEDVGQNVFLSLVEALPNLREPAALPGWLVTTARRECLRMLEVMRRRRARELDLEVDVVDTRLAPVEQGVVAAERDAALRAAFAQLMPHCQRLLALLMQTPPLSYAEISARLQMPIGGIGPNRARCLQRLRQCPALVAWIEAESGRGGG